MQPVPDESRLVYDILENPPEVFSVRKRFGKSLWELTLLALLGLSATTLSSQSSQGGASAEMERDFQAAMAAQDQGDTERAEALLSKLHKAHPGIFAVDESLGLLLASRGDVSGALPLLEAAVREQSSSDAAHANLGAAYYQLHRNQPAIDEFERAVRINPRNVSAQRSLGRISHGESQAGRKRESLRCSAAIEARRSRT